MQPDKTNPPLKFRKLRVAWSVFWGLACVLLIVLWVRSYRTGDRTHVAGVDVSFIDSRKYLYDASSENGAIHLFACASKPPWRTHFDVNKLGFGICRNPSIGISFPNWFPVLIFGTVATVPWLCWRFTLSTLLITMTLFAVVLGLVMWAAR